MRGRLKTVSTDIFQHKVLIGYVDENLVTHAYDVSSVDIAVDLGKKINEWK